ncbi:T-complex protein 1 subunit zeta [Ooceraea biroi]|uniref:T-complex protein 1 subunit zeta n=1 Tax=Ooceraea biroi TaxID=2015173 RepID=A0A026VUX8_OOCBI|nr:T-complex protein 1 subunit zeta [Ooceraea biroi]
MASIGLLNPNAEHARASQALGVNISAAKGIQDIMKTNLGPKGTTKMLVSGAGDIKITKDGNVLLHEMQIQHPTASLIARASTAQDDMTGDGTTSTVLVIGELLKQADLYIGEGLHPRVLTEGFDLARAKVLEVLESLKIPIDPTKQVLLVVARTSLRTKLHPTVADKLTEICVDAVLAIKQQDKEIDLHMVELMEMQHRTAIDTTLIRGIVTDHGARHPDMPKRLENAYILTCNVSLEYEKSEVNSGFFYKSAEEREKLVAAERVFIDNRVKKIIELKKKLCDGTNKSFVVINQKGIDPQSLDMLAKENIIALRRAKRRNMERLALACGGIAMNSVDDLKEEYLGWAGVVYEHILVSVFIVLIIGPNKYTLEQLKDAVRDGLRAIKNAIDDRAVIPGAGAFEVAASQALQRYKEQVKGKQRLGVQAYAEALLVIPKILAVNSGFDAQDIIVKLLEESTVLGEAVGLDLSTGEALKPVDAGRLHKNFLIFSTIIASNLLLVDEIMRAGLSSLKG